MPSTPVDFYLDPTSVDPTPYKQAIAGKDRFQFVNGQWIDTMAVNPTGGAGLAGTVAPQPAKSPDAGDMHWTPSLPKLPDANKAGPVVPLRGIGDFVSEKWKDAWNALPDADFDASRLLSSREKRIADKLGGSGNEAASDSPPGVQPGSAPAAPLPMPLNLPGAVPSVMEPISYTKPAPPARGGAGLGVSPSAGRRPSQSNAANSTPAALTGGAPQSPPSAQPTAPETSSPPMPRQDYYERVFEALEPARLSEDQIAQRRSDNIRMALLQAGLGTLAASGRPGMSGIGAIGAGGLAGLAGYRQAQNADADAIADANKERMARASVLARMADARATADATRDYRDSMIGLKREAMDIDREQLAERRRANDMANAARWASINKPYASAVSKPPMSEQEFVSRWVMDADRAVDEFGRQRNPAELAQEARAAYSAVYNPAPSMPPVPEGAYTGDEPPPGIDARRAPNGVWYETRDGQHYPVMSQ